MGTVNALLSFQYILDDSWVHWKENNVLDSSFTFITSYFQLDNKMKTRSLLGSEKR